MYFLSLIFIYFFSFSLFFSSTDGIPTSVDFIRDEPNKLVVAYERVCAVFDTETAAIVARLEVNGVKGVNRVVAHPTLPLVVAAHEDRHLRFYDHRSATLAYAMVAHLGAVTSLAVDPNGLYLLSGSKYHPFFFTIFSIFPFIFFSNNVD